MRMYEFRITDKGMGLREWTHERYRFGGSDGTWGVAPTWLYTPVQMAHIVTDNFPTVDDPHRAFGMTLSQKSDLLSLAREFEPQWEAAYAKHQAAAKEGH